MLDERPITQRVLAGAGAFAGVFGAAMAASAFMISGGFDFGGTGTSVARSAPTPITVRQMASDQNSASLTTAPMPTEQQDEGYEPLYASNDADQALEGDAYGGEVGGAYGPNSDDILRDVQRDLERWNEEYRAREAERYNNPDPDPYAADKKPSASGF